MGAAAGQKRLTIQDEGGLIEESAHASCRSLIYDGYRDTVNASEGRAVALCCLRWCYGPKTL